MICFAIISCLIAFVLAGSEIIPAPKGILEGGKIINGFDLDITDAPYQVSIANSNVFHFCGGSLISPDTVLTAAHCVYNIQYYNVYIQLGSSNLASGVGMPISNVAYHHEYNPSTNHNDIALIRMRGSVDLSDKIQPIELASNDPAPGTTALLSGWGIQAESNTQPPRKLQGVYLSITSLKECRQAYGDHVIQNTNVCTYFEGKGACKGDSGGALVADGKIVGVASWGNGCAREGYPDVYAGVAGNLDWIQKTIQRL